MKIRNARPEDESQIWEIFSKVVASGDTYVFPPDSDLSLFRENWMKYDPLVAIQDDAIVGTYVIKQNQIGLGSHIANGSYMVHPDWHSQGIGRRLAEHSLSYAKEKGFNAIQFNIVVTTNHPAIALWKKLGFRIIGTVPKAFKHQALGYVDAHVMYREI